MYLLWLGHAHDEHVTLQVTVMHAYTCSQSDIDSLYLFWLGHAHDEHVPHPGENALVRLVAPKHKHTAHIETQRHQIIRSCAVSTQYRTSVQCKCICTIRKDVGASFSSPCAVLVDGWSVQ